MFPPCSHGAVTIIPFPGGGGTVGTRWEHGGNTVGTLERRGRLEQAAGNPAAVTLASGMNHGSLLCGARGRVAPHAGSTAAGITAEGVTAAGVTAAGHVIEKTTGINGNQAVTTLKWIIKKLIPMKTNQRPQQQQGYQGRVTTEARIPRARNTRATT